MVSRGREREGWARRSLGFEPPPYVHLARLVQMKEQLAASLLLLLSARLGGRVELREEGRPFPHHRLHHLLHLRFILHRADLGAKAGRMRLG